MPLRLACVSGNGSPLVCSLWYLYDDGALWCAMHRSARLAALLPEGEFEFDPEDIGTQPLRFFVVEFLREAAFEVLEDELPYAFTAEVEEFREHSSPVYIRVTLLVERESQKGMIIGQGGRTIKAIGSHARARLEALLGQPVYLDCWVKVLPNWRRNAASLSRLGFPEDAPAS